ncbi:MAG: glycosyltransferase [Saprospiraceae bacterium]|nr:glycosyltransferase [Saprospiraceae bacterium]
MKLSIIIVNYNVKYFLRQLLQSIQASVTNFRFEIIVVDNASSDGSVIFLEKDFPHIKLIENTVNLGFSKANNVGIKCSKGEFILLLNPDTILQEDTLMKVIAYMDDHPDVGALGCRMIDGSGHFLPESKRGFPSPRVALFKSLGLSAMFPGSGYFNAYYLGHLDEFEINEVDVLTGAFMLLSRKALQASGLLDEDFFMYGEDIDLSYRIKKNDFKVIYYPLTTIIHFKGESTKKQSVEYIQRFYGAMQIFARKHYRGSRAIWLRLVLQMGIVLRATLAILHQFFHRFGPILLEWFGIAGSLKLFSLAWAHFYYQDDHYYDLSSIDLNISLYASVWVISLLMSGAYDQLFQWRRLLRGLMLGWVAIAAMYGFLGASFRPSRSLVLGGGAIASILIFTLRMLYFRVQKGSWPFRENAHIRYAIVGQKRQADKIQRLLKANHQKLQYLGYIDHGSTADLRSHYIWGDRALRSNSKISSIGRDYFLFWHRSIK